MKFMPKNAKNNLLGIVSLITLAGCSLPGIAIFQDSESGSPLNAGDASTVHFFTKELSHDTGIQLQSGANYAVAITILSNWMDSDIAFNDAGDALDERGFSNGLMPFELIGLTRRSRSNQWFELMLQQPNCSGDSLTGVNELNYDEESRQYSFTAKCDGKLSLFVNDSYGFYGNNVGYATIELSRVN